MEYNSPDSYWYNHRYDIKSGQNMKGCFFSLTGVIILVILSLILGSCRSIKSSVEEKENIEDSTETRYIEKVVKVPVTVYVEVPVEKQQRETQDTTSVVETSLALSVASLVWVGDTPTLFHSIENKPQRIEVADSVATVEKETVMWKTRTVTKTKTVFKEKELSAWEKVYMSIGKIALIVFIIILLVIFVICVKRIIL